MKKTKTFEEASKEKYGVLTFEQLSVEQFKSFITDNDYEVLRMTDSWGEPILHYLIYRMRSHYHGIKMGQAFFAEYIAKDMKFIHEILTLMKSSKKVCELLLNQVNINKQTPLAVAIERDETLWIVSKLIKLGAKTSITDDLNRTIYDIICNLSKKHNMPLYGIKEVLINRFFTKEEVEKNKTFNRKFKVKLLLNKDIIRLWNSEEMKIRMNAN